VTPSKGKIGKRHKVVGVGFSFRLLVFLFYFTSLKTKKLKEMESEGKRSGACRKLEIAS